MSDLCVSCLIKGKVQGVYYRASTKEKADSLNLLGWVKNLSNGDVEAKICGDEDIVNEMIAWMHEGPTYAVVTSVEIKELPYEEFKSFEIVY